LSLLATRSDSGFWVELILILVTQLRISCWVTYLIPVERRVGLSLRRRFINTELVNKLIVFFFFSSFIIWIIASSSLSAYYLVAYYACLIHQFIIGASLSSNSQQVAWIHNSYNEKFVMRHTPLIKKYIKRMS
jgi:hypothetical protein